MELKCVLDIIEVINIEGDYVKAYSVLRSQNHSGMSHSLVVSGIISLCSNGQSFVDWCKHKGYM